MKQSKITIYLTTILILTVIITAAIRCSGKGTFIEFKDVENTVLIEMQQTSDESSYSSLIHITEQSDIELIISALSTAKQVSFTKTNVINKLPMQEEEYMTVSTYTVDGRMNDRFYLYGGEFVYVEFGGIYKITGGEYAKIYYVFFVNNTTTHPFLIIE